MNSKGVFPSLRWSDTAQALFQQSREQHRQQICSSKIPSLHVLPAMRQATGGSFLWKTGLLEVEQIHLQKELNLQFAGSLQQSPAALWLPRKDLRFQAPAPEPTSLEKQDRPERSQTGSCFSPSLLEYPAKLFPKLLKTSSTNHQPSKIKDYFNPTQTNRGVELCCLKSS